MKSDRSERGEGRPIGEWVVVLVCLLAAIGSAFCAFFFEEIAVVMLVVAILFVAAALAMIIGWTVAGSRRLPGEGELSGLLEENAVLIQDMQVLNQRMERFLSQVPAVPGADLEQIMERIEGLDECVRTLSRNLDARLPQGSGSDALDESSAATPLNLAMTPTVELVQNAIDDGAVALFLQPIMTCTDQSNAGYEASLRILDPKGRPFDETGVAAIVRSRGFEITLDSMLLERAIRVATHFRNRQSETSILCSFSDRSFADQPFLRHLFETLEHRRDLAGLLWPAISQSDIALLSTRALEVLSGLNDIDFRFVMDDLRDLKTEPEILRRAGFGMVRAHHRFFQRSTPDRDAECLTLLGGLRKDGIKVVANHLDTDDDMSGLLNGVDAGQGALFSTPRMVRAELVETGTSGITAEAG